MSYVEDSKIDEQGFKIRLNVNDTIQTVKDKVVEFMGDTGFLLIEIERLRSGFCQL